MGGGWEIKYIIFQSWTVLATTLPSNQNIIYLYEDDEGNSAHHNQKDKVLFGRFRGDEGKQQRAIILRNITYWK